MKGIILAGGSGTRLYPITKVLSKQLMAIYDKPMIYYPLSILMLAGIRDILIISTPNDLTHYESLLGDGHQLGIKFTYIEQPSPDGLPQAFILGEHFIKNNNVCLILGDNLFYGENIRKKLQDAVTEVESNQNAVIFGCFVNDANRYGVVEFDKNGNAITIEEKPKNPKSNYAVSGLYFYPNNVVEISKKQIPSSRNELEITDTNNFYLSQKKLKVEKMGRGYAWLDTGTHDSLLEASHFVQTLEKRQGVKISCIEEIAYRMEYISKNELKVLGQKMKNNQYGQYLLKIADSN